MISKHHFLWTGCAGLLLLAVWTGADRPPRAGESAAADKPQAAEQPLRFEARLEGKHVAPDLVETGASAVATAVLVGKELTVHGSFTSLSSRLRDIEETPDDPGVHLHPGKPGEVNPYLFGLRARLNDDERSGLFSGTFELNDEQLALLLSGRIYIDIHTVKNDPGEVRDQLRPRDEAAAEARLSHVRRRLQSLPEQVRAKMRVKLCSDPATCTCDPSDVPEPVQVNRSLL